MRESCDLDGNRWTCCIDIFSLVVLQCSDFSECTRTDDIVSLLDSSRIDEDRGDRAKLLIEMRLDDRGNCPTIWIGLEFEHLCLEQYHIEEVLDTETGMSGYRDDSDCPSPLFRLETLFCELPTDKVEIGTRLIHLVHRNDHGNFSSFRVIDRLDRLWLHPFIGGDDDDRNIRELGSTGSHDREGFMTRSVEKCDTLVSSLDLIGTDLLCYTSSFTRCYGCLADRIEDRCFSMVDMSHHGDDGTSLNEMCRIIFMDEFFDIAIHEIRDRDILRDFFVDLDTEYFTDDEARIIVDRSVEIHENPIFHEFSHDFCYRDPYLIGEFLHRDHIWDIDFLPCTIDEDLLHFIEGFLLSLVSDLVSTAESSIFISSDCFHASLVTSVDDIFSIFIFLRLLCGSILHGRCESDLTLEYRLHIISETFFVC